MRSPLLSNSCTLARFVPLAHVCLCAFIGDQLDPWTNSDLSSDTVSRFSCDPPAKLVSHGVAGGVDASCVCFFDWLPVAGKAPWPSRVPPGERAHQWKGGVGLRCSSGWLACHVSSHTITSPNPSLTSMPGCASRMIGATGGIFGVALRWIPNQRLSTSCHMRKNGASQRRSNQGIGTGMPLRGSCNSVKLNRNTCGAWRSYMLHAFSMIIVYM